MCTVWLSDNWEAGVTKELYTAHHNERAWLPSLAEKKIRYIQADNHVTVEHQTPRKLLPCCRERVKNWKWYVSWRKKSLNWSPSSITYNIPDLTKITLSFWISFSSSLTWKSYYLLFCVTELWRSNVLMNAKEPFKS